MTSALHRDLSALLGSAVVAGPDMAPYNTGYRGEVGNAAAVVRPQTTQQVAALVQYAHKQQIPIISQGANTGLVGASIADESGTAILISTERMRAHRETSSVDRTAWWQAGARLSDINREAEKIGCSFPIDLGSDPSLGGMIATNTQGARLLRYGDVRANLTGLQVVLLDQDGTIVEDLSGLRKNNTGIDVKQIFVGAGGAGGIITEAKVRLHPLPARTAAALLLPASREAIDALVWAVESQFGEFLSACEGMSRMAMDAAFQHQQSLRNPFSGDRLPDYAILVELSIAAQAAAIDLDTLLVEGLATIAEQFPALEDAFVGDPAALWALRHAISDGVKALGQLVAFDLAFPRAHVEAFFAAATEMLSERFPSLKVADFGHRGDGGVHFNLVHLPHKSAPLTAADITAIRTAVYDIAVWEYGGSFSAEHGIGPVNRAFVERYTAPGVALVRRRLADAFPKIPSV
ncbi:FAD-binding oxidoreductase [Blastomonas sp. UPD001]|uniref:FAD-binding oxidoreductase n=1 Tax=Blastomonas sp. UPD001 TaxID=2217673 RepID=UPI000E340CED|nr:FAD-binding oxidoreductase [Blastomonas sp. UPD001]